MAKATIDLKPGSKIVIDIDDVLSISGEAFVEFSNRKWGGGHKIEDVSEDWPAFWKVDIDTAIRRREIYFASKAHKDYKPRHKAKDIVKELASRYSLVILTSRSKEVHSVTIEWIEEHFPGIFDDIHFAGIYDGKHIKREMVKLTKAEFIHEIGGELLIDDQPKHTHAAARSGVPSILFGEYPWNKDANPEKGVTRAKNWDEVYDLLLN